MSKNRRTFSEPLRRNKLLELFSSLNRENETDQKAIMLREIDCSRMCQIKDQRQSLKIPFSAFMIRAVALTLERNPSLNRVLVKRPFSLRILQLHEINISIAVERADAGTASEPYEGAFIYTVYNADKKKLEQITTEIQNLSTTPLDSTDVRIERWRLMKKWSHLLPVLWPLRWVTWIHKNFSASYRENRGGSFIISSPAKYGVDAILGHWVYPLGMSFGLIKERAIVESSVERSVESSKVVVRKTCHISLSFDRRLTSGSQAARFLNELCHLIESGAFQETEIIELNSLGSKKVL